MPLIPNVNNRPSANAGVDFGPAPWLLVAAGFDNPTVVQEVDAIGRANGGKSMGDHDHETPLARCEQIRHQLILRLLLSVTSDLPYHTDTCMRL